MKEVGRYEKGTAQDAPELIADLAGGCELQVTGDLAWIVGAKGWRTFEGASGQAIVIELSAEECLAHLNRDAETIERERGAEEQLREQSRAARDLGPASTRAPR